MNETQTYTVATDQPLAILGRMHPPGGTVTLHPRQAAAHLRTGALVEGAPAPPKPPPKPTRKARARSTPATEA